MNYDILISSSINRLDSSMVISLLAINIPVQPRQISVSPSRHQVGLTLIEIMIALLIGVFLLGGIIQIFIGSKQTYRMQENLSRLQENGRFAMYSLDHDIRMTGYWGCHSGTNTDITGADNNTGVTGIIDEGTDSITLLGAFVLAPTTESCGSSANATNSCCTTDPSLTANICPVANLANCFTAPSSTISYKINNAVLQQGSNGLVEGIENMQILYGEDTDMNCATGTSVDYVPNYYVAANLVVNMCRVVSIRITLTARTLDGNLTPVGDGRIRRDFTSTIAVRNRLL